jgi:hypothetical protein
MHVWNIRTRSDQDRTDKRQHLLTAAYLARKSGFRKLRKQAFQGALHKQHGAATQTLIFPRATCYSGFSRNKMFVVRAVQLSDTTFIDPDERRSVRSSPMGELAAKVQKFSSARFRTVVPICREEAKTPLSEIWTHGRMQGRRRWSQIDNGGGSLRATPEAQSQLAVG